MDDGGACSAGYTFLHMESGASGSEVRNVEAVV